MKLNYFQLLSSAPIYIQGIGGIVSPKLKDISAIGYNTYQQHLNFLLMDLKTFLTTIGRPDDYECLTEEQKINLQLYDVLAKDVDSAVVLQSALDFFIVENVEFLAEHKAFMVKRDEDVIGCITRENFKDVVDIICQRINIKTKDLEDASKVKNKKALSIMQKLKKGREDMAKQAKVDKNMELGNIISAVANKSQSLNIINIWDLTVFQLWDCFNRLTNNNIYDINAASVSAWGDKDNKFDFNGWFKQLNN